MKTFREVIALWPSLSDLAADVGVAYGVAKQWKIRDSIPSGSWAALVAAAERRGFAAVSNDALAEIARIRRDRIATEAA